MRVGITEDIQPTEASKTAIIASDSFTGTVKIHKPNGPGEEV